MKRRAFLLSSPFALAAGCGGMAARPDNAVLVQQVASAELAFARSMAERDYAAFRSLLADEAIFLMGGKPLRGKLAVAEHWKRFFTEPRAPFSWKPDHVQVLDSGTLGMSTGPVTRADGKLSGRFYSTWRREGDGIWRIVFDDGCNLERCA